MKDINFRFGDWELPGEGEKETLIQKYQRLQCEIKELYEEVNDLKVFNLFEIYLIILYNKFIILFNENKYINIFLFLFTK